ncbi:hypothetical protein BD324DRAFT_626645 [Kockovaella imperatae]|uniref:CID domain-containing protein n=1 Tax=Kockovaella imperatae TaxID=4999 RepID=A0A1Y1UF72_9TREE|nr:hypothetical protein BD324DRAFT_626645 [Kockovaella imperatae]ORX36639.1 hypothetical protein BD324DRAFT_626645 [Kockovaella imperatae]
MSYPGYQPPYQGQPPPSAPPQQPFYGRHPPPNPQVLTPSYSGTQTVEQFRMEYAGRLSTLTFNSRPIIQDLSILAMQERDRRDWAKMNVVVQEIEAAVQRAPPHAKLPVLYLVDSISKNVGAPFTTQLLPHVMPRMFVAAYREVDGVTRSKMEEMVALWRTSGPDGSDLYGREVREAVERDLFGSGGVSSRGPYPTRERVLQTLHATLEMKHREITARPWDPEPSRQTETLKKILMMITTSSVHPQQLGQIMETLQAMVPPGQSAPVSEPPPPSRYAPPVTAWLPPTSTHYPPPPAGPPSNPSMPPFPPQLPRDQYGVPLAPTMGTPQLPVPTPDHHQRSLTPQPGPASSAAAPAFIPENVAALIRNLNTAGIAGLGSAPRTPESEPMNLGKPKSSLNSYEEMILNLDVRLESLDLNKMISLPVSHLPQRCTQCGMRFSDADGAMQAHLDWHFRRNRKQRESEGRGAHRRWLPRGEEWIQQSVITVEAGPSTSNEKSSKLTAERIAQLKKKRVKVPSNSDIAARPCPICKELFKAEWSEEDEEWVWRNAIDINEKRTSGDPQIYHATCRAEQMAARVANRLLKDGDGRRTNSKSPRLTPGVESKVEGSRFGHDIKVEHQLAEDSQQINGKRKAEEESTDSKRVKVEPGSEAAVEEVPAKDVGSIGIDDGQQAEKLGPNQTVDPPQLSAQVVESTAGDSASSAAVATQSA